LLVLCAAVVVIWCHTWDRTSAADWAVPTSYSGDSQQILGWIKAASEGDYKPFCMSFVKRLGAPYTANWNDYPMYEKPLTYFLGLIAKSFGLFQAANFGMLLAPLTAVVSFYLCCRFLRYPRIWSFTGALLFACLYYTFNRGLGHLLLAFTYTLPFAILSTWLIGGSRRMRWGDASCWMCLVTAVVLGLGNPYNLWMYLQLAGFGLLANLLVRRRKENLVIGAISIGLALASFAAINAPVFVYQWIHGRNLSAVVRFYVECELMALKPMELIIPPPNHHLEFMRAISDNYKYSALVKGEVYSPYLGFIGVAGLAWLFAEALVRVLRPRPGRFPAYSLQSLWVFCYATLGGLNCLIGFGGLMLFRSSNRYSLFLGTFSLLFLVSRLSRCTRTWAWPWRAGLAGLILAVGLYDQIPRPIPHEDTLAVAKIIENDRAFCNTIEQKLPPKSMIYQFPAMDFPDAYVNRNVGSYEHLRPFFHTKTLRFSFGTDRGRPREDWQIPLGDIPLKQTVDLLEAYGFSAMYLNRKAFTNHLDTLVTAFKTMGKTPIIEDDLREQVCVFLNPSPNPQLPRTDELPLIGYEKGFSPYFERTAELDRHWTTGKNATMTFFNPDGHPVDYHITMRVGTISERYVVIDAEGGQVWKGRLPAKSEIDVDMKIKAKPRYNLIRFKTEEDPVTAPEITGPPVSIGVAAVKIIRLDTPR